MPVLLPPAGVAFDNDEQQLLVADDNNDNEEYSVNGDEYTFGGGKRGPSGNDNDDYDGSDGKRKGLSRNSTRSNITLDHDVISMRDQHKITFKSLRKEAMQLLQIAVPVSITRLFVGVTRVTSIFYIGRLTSQDSLAAASLAGTRHSLT